MNSGKIEPRFERFDTWADVIDAARRGEMLWYQAPLDPRPRYIGIVKVYKNDKLRIDPLSPGADKFNADAGHLARFRRRMK